MKLERARAGGWFLIHKTGFAFGMVKKLVSPKQELSVGYSTSPHIDGFVVKLFFVQIFVFSELWSRLRKGQFLAPTGPYGDIRRKK